MLVAAFYVKSCVRFGSHDLKSLAVQRSSLLRVKVSYPARQAVPSHDDHDTGYLRPQSQGLLLLQGQLNSLLSMSVVIQDG